MATHGVKKADPKLKDNFKLTRIKAYQDSCAMFNALRKTARFGSEELDLIEPIVVANPDYYSVWNHRRRIIERLKEEDLLKACEKELALTAACVQQHPKSYWVWLHRRWVLEKIHPAPDWKQELVLVGLMLNLDARNFHGWDYRRVVVEKLRLASGGDYKVQEEFAYSEKKIAQSFSNGSAWHYRSALLPKMLSLAASEAEAEKLLDKEFYLLQQAIYTDPSDQSAWFYYCALLQDLPKLLSLVYHDWNDDKARKVVEREQLVVQELLEVLEGEPAKVQKWPLNMLLFISRMEGNNSAKIISQLEVVDPSRKGRYRQV